MNKIIEACNFAADKHKNQRRKDNSKTPYINHPIEVANKLSNCGINDSDILVACLLHDTIEDTETTKEEIKQKFGEKVLNIVMECSDDKTLSKVERKRKQIEHSKEISNEAKLVKLSDKYCNLSDLIKNPPTKWSKQEIEGYALWCYAVFLNMIK